MAFLCEVLGHTLPKAGVQQPVPNGILDPGPFDYVGLPDVRDVRMDCARCKTRFTVCRVRVPPSGRQRELEQFVNGICEAVEEAKSRKPKHR